MSKKITLSSKLPGDPETNGLDSLAEDLVKKPHQVVVALVFLDVPKVTLDTETDTETPTVRIRKIEPLAQPVSKAITDAFLHASEQRLGRTPLPFDVLDAPPKGIDDEDDGEDGEAFRPKLVD